MHAFAHRRVPVLLVAAGTVALALLLAIGSSVAWHPDPACAHPSGGGGAGCFDPTAKLGRGDKLGLDRLQRPWAGMAPGRPGPAPARAAGADRARFEFVSHTNPGGGFNADVVAHKGVAYLASWGTEGACPSQGVRAYSLQDPANPRLLSVFADGARDAEAFGSWTEKVIVRSVDTRWFEGDLAAVSFQSCAGEEGFRGFGVYDVTNPARPVKLALVATNKAANGSHEIWLDTRGGRAHVYTAIILSELTTSPDYDPETGEATIPGEPDFQIWDVSRPRRPVKAGEWGAWKELGIEPISTDANGTVRVNFTHSVITAGGRAYLSYWDLGTVILDVRDPARPRFIGRTRFRAHEEGNAHSAWLAHGGRVLIQTDEDFDPSPDPNGVVETSWGYPRYFDISDPAHPRRLSTFKLPSTTQFPPPDDGFYTVHDPKVRGGVNYLSWYAEGVLALDLRGDRRPRFLAQFRPTAAPDPQGLFPARTIVWGVFPYRGLVLASDINSGLWVLRLRR
jgi:hypothetical protein